MLHVVCVLADCPAESFVRRSPYGVRGLAVLCGVGYDDANFRMDVTALAIGGFTQTNVART